MARFVHLRLHSEYSIQDGIVRVDAAVGKAKQDGQPALAITDLGNTFAYIKFYKAARSAGVKPLLGADVWITNDADRDRPYRLLLLVQNDQGYKNLCEVITRAWLHNSVRDRGEVRLEWFSEAAGAGRLGEGLIALSCGLQGEVADDAPLSHMVNVLGQGRCAITLDPKDRLPGQQPYQGVVPLYGDRGEKLEKLSEVIEHYMLQSEQLDTRLVLAANDQMAAGLLIQRLPLQGEANLALAC